MNILLYLRNRPHANILRTASALINWISYAQRVLKYVAYNKWTWQHFKSSLLKQPSKHKTMVNGGLVKIDKHNDCLFRANIRLVQNSAAII